MNKLEIVIEALMLIVDFYVTVKALQTVKPIGTSYEKLW